jgi:hypothetical protein
VHRAVAGGFAPLGGPVRDADIRQVVVGFTQPT